MLGWGWTNSGGYWIGWSNIEKWDNCGLNEGRTLEINLCFQVRPCISHLLNISFPSSLLSFIPLFSHPCFHASLLCYIPPFLPPSCFASFLSCLHLVLHPTCAAFHALNPTYPAPFYFPAPLLSLIPPFLYPSFPASLLSWITHFLHFRLYLQKTACKNWFTQCPRF